MTTLILTALVVAKKIWIIPLVSLALIGSSVFFIRTWRKLKILLNRMNEMGIIKIFAGKKEARHWLLAKNETLNNKSPIDFDSKMVNVFFEAIKVFGNIKNAEIWLVTPNIMLCRHKPIEHENYQDLLDELGRIEHGILI